MRSKTISLLFKDEAEPLEGIWGVYAYLNSLNVREAKLRLLKAISPFWQAVAYQELGEKESGKSAALRCIYQLEQHRDYLREVFANANLHNDPVRLDYWTGREKISFRLKVELRIDTEEAALLSYLQKRKRSYNFEAMELARWALVPYWQPIALSHLEAEPSLISQSAGHCLYLLEKQIQYLRESFGLMNSKVSFSPALKTETVSHSENGWHDTTEDDEIIGNIFN